MAGMLRASLWLGMVVFFTHHGAIADGSEDLCGKNFVFAFPPNLHPSSNKFQVVLTSCGSTSRTMVNISTPSHDIQYFSTQAISDSESLTVTLPDEIADEREIFFIHGTLLISSSHDITVVAVSGQKRTMATFPIIPTASLGQEYMVISYVNEEESNGLPAEFVISSLSENTHVTIQLSGDALPSNDWSVQYTAQEQVQLDLFDYDSVLFRSAEGLTGTQIWSDKPISVVAGSACIFVPNDFLACDHIVEHIPPVNRWGFRYIIPPFMGRHSGYIYRVLAARDDTRVTYNDEEESGTVLVAKGEFIERNVDEDYVSLVTADKPILVALYAKGNFTDGIGDPAMLIVTPIEQYVSEVTFSTFNVSEHGIQNEYLTVVVVCDHLDNLRLDGMPLEGTDGSVLRSDGYCVFRRPLLTNGLTQITSVNSDTKFTAFQYGFGTRIAYGHPVAFGLRKITCKGYDKFGSVKEQKCKPQDTEKPMINCPNNVTLYTYNGGVPTLSWEEPIAVDDSDDVVEVNSNYQPGSEFSVGITCVTYEAVDSSGNTEYCSFYITVKAVSIICPPDKQVIAGRGKSSMPVTWHDPVVKGADTKVIITSNHKPEDQFPMGFTTVTYDVRDQINAVVTDCSFRVYVIDKEPPVIVCPDNLEIFTPSGNTEVDVTWDAPTVSDNSGHVMGMNISHVPGGRFPIGTSRVIYTVWDQERNAATCAFYVTVYAQCVPGIDNSVLTWPVTTAGDTAESNQRCPINTERRGYGLAKRYCAHDDILGARWEDQELQSCGMTTSTVELHDLEKTPVVEDNVEEVAIALVEVTAYKNVSTNDGGTAVAKTLENIVGVESTSVEVTSSVIQVVDNFIESASSNTTDTPLSTDESTSSSILNSLEDQISASLQAGQELKAVRSNIAVEGVQLKPNTTIGDLSFAVLSTKSELDSGRSVFDDESVQVFKNANEVPRNKVETSIQLPKSLLSMSGNQKDLQISFTVFQDDILFPSKRVQNGSSKLAGSIISASIEDVHVVYLTDPVVIEITPTKLHGTDFNFNDNNTGCYFYDKTKLDWSRDGCKPVWSDDVTSDGRIVCHCDHLTNFAVIVDWSGQGGIDNSKHAFALDVISKLGCALSVIALAITIIVFLLFRRLRNTRPRHILIHFCFSLFFLYLIFLAGIDASKSTIGCTIVAALLHYLTLATVAWMGVEARNMYLTLVKVFDAESPNFMAWACGAAWGVPLLVTVTTLSAAFHHYRNKDYCFLSPGPSLYFGLLLPVVLILLHNFVTFALVMRRLLRANVGGTIKEKNRFHHLSMRLQNALAISVLLGLTWVFGFFAIDDATFAFQLLFCLFNAFQGVVVFLLFCLRQEDVRKTLMPYFTWAKCPQWSLPEWKAVPTKVTTTMSTSNGAVPPASPTSKDQDTSLDLASTTDVSMTEVRTPLRS